jgi:tetratricopeptide (TPR) repeat protein
MSGDRYRVLSLEDVESIPVVGGTIRWKPLRRALGVRAFGINAYVADAGEDVIEEHQETGGPGEQEELYLVMRGAATFTLDGEERRAPAGTAVFLPDPMVTRKAVATQDGTLIVAVGAPRGLAYEPAAWEHWFMAAPAADAGDFAGAAETLERGLEEKPEHPVILYNAACWWARAGRPEEAIDRLRRAHAADPERVGEWGQGDSDLDSLRGRPDWPL